MHEPDIRHPVCQVIARLGTLCKTAAVGTGVYDDVELNTGLSSIYDDDNIENNDGLD